MWPCLTMWMYRIQRAANRSFCPCEMFSLILKESFSMKLPAVTKTQYPRLSSVRMFDPWEVEPLFRLIRICPLRLMMSRSGLCLTAPKSPSTQPIRQGPLDKEWDWAHTITAGDPVLRHLHLHLLFLITFSFCSVVSLLLLVSFCIWFFPFSQCFSLSLQSLLHF